MFSHLHACFEAGVPDDALAVFLSESGELAKEDCNVFFCLPDSNMVVKDALLWWYISDSFHCGKLLDERHYKSFMVEEPKSMSIATSNVPETNFVDVEIRRSFYFCPEDEEFAALKAKLTSLGESVLEELSASITDSLIIISKYQKYPNHSQVYSPFYLARMLDNWNNDTSLLLGPCEDALDKPCPTEAVEPKKFLTLSGFKGEERARLQVMITLMGSRCTDYLTPATNILVTKERAYNSRKAQAAKNWSISIKDKSWLEESFAKWQWQI